LVLHVKAMTTHKSGISSTELSYLKVQCITITSIMVFEQLLKKSYLQDDECAVIKYIDILKDNRTQKIINEG
jgi:hypothetical protein